MLQIHILEERIVQDIERMSVAGLDAATLHQRAAKLIQRVVPYDIACSTNMDPTSGLVNHVFGIANGHDAQRMRHYYEHIYFTYGADDYRRLVREASPVASLTTHPLSSDAHTRIGQHWLAQYGMAHELHSVFVSGRAAWGSLTVFRASSQPPFTDQERAFIARIAPYLGVGLRAASLRASPSTDNDERALAMPGVFVLDPQGHIIQYTAAAEHWLGMFGDLSEGWEQGDGLPVAVWVAVGALHHHAQSDNEALPTSVHTQARNGRWFRLQATRMEGTPTRMGETVVVVEPLRPHEMAQLRTMAYQLSDREQEVLNLVVGDASTQRIANTLHISTYTVQEHLTHIFDKVGVRTRRALVKKLYLESEVVSPQEKREVCPPVRSTLKHF